jgi:hypothetical protein
MLSDKGEKCMQYFGEKTQLERYKFAELVDEYINFNGGKCEEGRWMKLAYYRV